MRLIDFWQDSCVSKIEYWKKKYDRGKAVDLLMMEPDLVVVVGLLKTWLSELPEPLIPWTSYSKTMDTEGFFICFSLLYFFL